MSPIAPVAVLLAVLALPLAAEERPAAPLAASKSWDVIAHDVIGDATPQDGSALYTLEAPFRAHDAATVPIRFVQQEGAPDLKRLTLVVDENPSPVAAEFSFGPAMGPIDLEMRIRIDAYSNVRAIAEAADGTLYMTGGFVRAAGGCSAPAAKDAAAALAAMGAMKTRFFAAEPGQAGVRREAQVMLRHPNYSGLQRDPITLLFVPAHFVDSLEVRQGDEVLFSMTGGISISEDPSFRFRYTDTGAGALSVRATDTEGNLFAEEFAAGS